MCVLLLLPLVHLLFWCISNIVIIIRDMVEWYVTREWRTVKGAGVTGSFLELLMFVIYVAHLWCLVEWRCPILLVLNYFGRRHFYQHERPQEAVWVWWEAVYYEREEGREERESEECVFVHYAWLQSVICQTTPYTYMFICSNLVPTVWIFKHLFLQTKRWRGNEV